MKTYIFTYLRKNNDSNGNPRHYIIVYRIKKNIPIKVLNIDVGFRSKVQSIIQELKYIGEIPKTINSCSSYTIEHEHNIKIIELEGF